MLLIVHTRKAEKCPAPHKRNLRLRPGMFRQFKNLRLRLRPGDTCSTQMDTLMEEIQELMPAMIDFLKDSNRTKQLDDFYEKCKQW